MKQKTIDMCANIIVQMEDGLTGSQLDEIKWMLSNHGSRMVGSGVDCDRVIRRSEVAKRFGVVPRTIDNYAARGILKPVKFPGMKQAFGYRESDVRALISGPAV